MPSELEEVIPSNMPIDLMAYSTHSLWNSFPTEILKYDNSVRPSSHSAITTLTSPLSRRKLGSILPHSPSNIQSPPTVTSKGSQAISARLQSTSSSTNKAIITHASQQIAKNAITILINLSTDPEILEYLASDVEFIKTLLTRTTVRLPSLLQSPHLTQSEPHRTQCRRPLYPSRQSLQITPSSLTPPSPHAASTRKTLLPPPRDKPTPRHFRPRRLWYLQHQCILRLPLLPLRRHYQNPRMSKILFAKTRIRRCSTVK